MTARQLGNVLVEGVGSGNETVREVLTQRTVIDDPIDARMLKQRAQFRGETEKSVAHRIVKRLLAEAVSGEEQPAPRAVVDRECEHAVQPHGKTFAPLLVAVDQHLGIGVVGPEHVSFCDQRLSQLEVVVDFTVEDDTDLGVLVPHRLIAALDIKNCQAPVRKKDAIRRVDIPA